MIITEDIYNDLNKRIDNGEFLHRSTNETAEDLQLPSLDKDADSDTMAFRDQCQQTLDLYLAKIKALRAQLLSERKKQESNEALEDASVRTIEFNDLLEDKYSKLQKKSEEDARSNKKALKALQELSDKVLEENKRLKEENGKLKEENDKWQATFDREYNEMIDNAPSEAELQAQWKMEQEMEEWETNSTSKSVKEVIEFCVEHVSNIEDVSDSHVEPIKDMMEDLLESPLAELLLDSDKLELTKKLHGIKKTRKQLLNARNKMVKEKEENKEVTNNNYYAPIGQQINSAEKATIENKDKTKNKNHGQSEQ